MIWRRSNSVEISTPDPEYKVFYLGNVLTGWAKGENCVEKPLATLWRNYAQINKPDVTMRVLVCPSGLKATTRQHGLTEYWSNRITYCCSPKNYPRVFCWVYRHEGRKLKHELRCHAVLCTKDTVAEQICKTLKVSVFLGISACFFCWVCVCASVFVHCIYTHIWQCLRIMTIEREKKLAKSKRRITSQSQ